MAGGIIERCIDKVFPMKRRQFLKQSAGLAAATGVLGWPVAGLAATPDPFFESVFTNLQGYDVKARSLLGEPLLVNFWASWCPPCVREMPDLDALHKKHTGVRLVGVAIDTSANVNRFLQKVQVSYPLLVAGYGGIALMKQMGNQNGALPFTVAFSAQGQVIQRVLGQVNPEKIDQLLVTMGTKAG
jgi:thiol-disulfide isomerase/thioredoxin